MTSIEWADALTALLFDAEDRQFIVQVDELIHQNTQITGRPGGFNFNGINYGPEGTIVARAPSLAAELIPAMNQLQLHWDQVARDRGIIRQELRRLLRPCTFQRDIRDALPETVVELHSELSKLERLREPFWTLQEDPKALASFLKVLPKIDMYCSLRYLY